MIDKDGTIYQTASVHQRTAHVGKLRSRCMLELKCTDAERALNLKFKPTAEHRRERANSVPNRFPSNDDGIGIELVGAAVATDPKKPAVQTYERVTPEQNSSLQWLVSQLAITMEIPLTEVFRHPTVSRKNDTEASTAKW